MPTAVSLLMVVNLNNFVIRLPGPQEDKSENRGSRQASRRLRAPVQGAACGERGRGPDGQRGQARTSRSRGARGPAHEAPGRQDIGWGRRGRPKGGGEVRGEPVAGVVAGAEGAALPRPLVLGLTAGPTPILPKRFPKAAEDSAGRFLRPASPDIKTDKDTPTGRTTHHCSP